MQPIVSVEKALAFLVDTDLSVRTYKKMRQLTGNLPTYAAVLEKKSEIYPEPDQMEFTEVLAEADVGGLLKKTVSQILKVATDSGCTPGNYIDYKLKHRRLKTEN